MPTSMILVSSLGPNIGEDFDNDGEDSGALPFSFDGNLDRSRGISPGFCETLLLDNLSSSPVLLRKTLSIDPKYNAKTVQVNVMTL